MINKIFSHSFLYAIGPQIPRLANILVLPIITQYLTKTDYGVYGTLLAYMGLLSGIRMLGFDVLLVNSFFSKARWLEYWKRYFGGLYLYSILYAIISATFLMAFMPEEVGSNSLLVILLILIPRVAFEVSNGFGSRYLQLNKRPKYIAITSATVGLVSVFLNWYTIAILKLGYLGWFISTAIGESVAFIFYLMPLIKLRLKPILTLNKNFWFKGLRVSLPTIPHNYSSYLLNSSDRMVMDQLDVPIKEIGTYNLAYVFGGYMEMFGNAVGLAVGPFITELYAKKNETAERQVRSLIFLLQVVFIALCFIVSIWAKELFHLLIRNESLTDAYPIAIIIIMGYAYRPLYWAAGMKLTFYEKTRKLWRVSFTAGVINVALNIWLIPIYGIVAAAITTFVSLMYLGVSFFFLKDYKKLNNLPYYPLVWMIVISIMSLIAYALKEVSFEYKITVSLIAISIVLFSYFKLRTELNQVK